MQNFWTVARSGDKENTATNHWYRRPGTTGPNPLQYSAHDATGDKFSPFGFRSLPLPGSAVRTTQLAEGPRRARDRDGEAEPGGRRNRRRSIPGSVRAHLQQPARLLMGFGESSLPASRFLAA